MTRLWEIHTVKFSAGITPCLHGKNGQYTRHQPRLLFPTKKAAKAYYEDINPGYTLPNKDHHAVRVHMGPA